MRKGPSQTCPWVATTVPSWTRCITRCSLKTYFHKLIVFRKNQTTNSWSTKWLRDTTGLRDPSANCLSQWPSSKLQSPRLSYPRTSPAATSSSFRTKTNKGTNPKIPGSRSIRTKATGQGSPGTQRDSTVHPSRGSNCRDLVKCSRTIVRAMTRFKLLKNRRLTSQHGGSLNSLSARTKRIHKLRLWRAAMTFKGSSCLCWSRR